MRRVLTILLVIAILSTGVIFAANVNGLYKGFPIANVKLNGVKINSDVPAILFDSRTLLPVRAVTEAVNSVVQWDQKTQTATIIKPSINMIFAGDVVEEENGLTIRDAGSYFNTLGSGRWENLYVEIGPMESKTYEYRVAVYDPKGSLIGTSAVEKHVIDKRGLVVYLPIDNMTYSIPGQYKFKFQIKYDGEFQSIGETVAVVE